MFRFLPPSNFFHLANVSNSDRNICSNISFYNTFSKRVRKVDDKIVIEDITDEFQETEKNKIKKNTKAKDILSKEVLKNLKEESPIEKVVDKVVDKVVEEKDSTFTFLNL